MNLVRQGRTRCAEREMFGNRQCDRPAGHDGVHVAGIDAQGMLAWPVDMRRGIETPIPSRETLHREREASRGWVAAQ